MNNYRITIEPISEQAMKYNPVPHTLEVSGYILGAAETDPAEIYRNTGDAGLAHMHIHAQGTHVPETIVHMIDELPAHIMEKVAMRILEKRAALKADPLADILAGQTDICSDLEDMLRRFNDGL